MQGYYTSRLSVGVEGTPVVCFTSKTWELSANRPFCVRQWLLPPHRVLLHLLTAPPLQPAASPTPARPQPSSAARKRSPVPSCPTIASAISSNTSSPAYISKCAKAAYTPRSQSAGRFSVSGVASTFTTIPAGRNRRSTSRGSRMSRSSSGTDGSRNGGSGRDRRIFIGRMRLLSEEGVEAVLNHPVSVLEWEKLGPNV